MSAPTEAEEGALKAYHLLRQAGAPVPDSLAAEVERIRRERDLPDGVVAITGPVTIVG